MTKSLFLALAVVGMTAGPVLAETMTPVVANGDTYFTITWKAEQQGGTPTVTGHIANNYGTSAMKVRLLVDSLDATGKVVAQTLGHLDREVAPGQTANFNVRVPGQATNYRVSVFQFDWGQFGGAGEGGDGS